MNDANERQEKGQGSCEQGDIDGPVEVSVHDGRKPANLRQDQDQSLLQLPRVEAESGIICKYQEMSDTCGAQSSQEQSKKT